MGTPTVEDLKKAEDRNATLDLENKELKNKMEKMEQSMSEHGDEGKKLKQAMKDYEETKKKVDEQAKIIQAMQDNHKDNDEKDKNEMAAKIAKAKVAMGELDEKEEKTHAASLAKDHNARSLQALLTTTEGATKMHLEAQQAKAALENPATAFRYYLEPGQKARQASKEGDNKEYEAMLSKVRSGIY